MAALNLAGKTSGYIKLKSPDVALNATVELPNKDGILATLDDVGSGGGGGIPEAPTDGKQYARQNADWTEVTGGETATLESLGIPNHDKLDVITDDTNYNVIDFLNASVTTAIQCGVNNDRFVIKNGHSERIAVDTNGKVDITGSLYVNGSAVGSSGDIKAWVTFNGSNTVSIISSANVSSITDHGVGNYEAHFSTAMPDANYSIASSVIGTTDRGNSGWGTTPPSLGADGQNTCTTTSVRFSVLANSDQGLRDCNRISLQMIR